MPTYTYECSACGHRYDAFQSMKAEPDTECPRCSGRVDRVFGAGTGIVFKGSGFYVTDYRKGGSGGDSSSSSSSNTSTSAASSPSSSSSTPAASASGS